MKRARGGFTLVELLVTVSLLGMIAGTVAATFSGGMRVWERIQSRGTHGQWIEVTLDQVRRDIGSMRAFAPIEFKGEYDEVSFPALVSWTPRPTVDDKMPEPRDEPGRRGYYFDSGRRMLCRSEHPYRLTRRYRLKDACSPVMTEVDRVRFSYCEVDPSKGACAWTDGWDADRPPVAVKMEIGYHDAITKRDASNTLIVQVPVTPAPPAKPDGGKS